VQLLSVREPGTELMNEIYEKALGGNVLLSLGILVKCCAFSISTVGGGGYMMKTI
jgi:hypothetical protein